VGERVELEGLGEVNMILPACRILRLVFRFVVLDRDVLMFLT
jgi:hypothetical protein